MKFLVRGEKVLIIEALIEADTEDEAIDAFHECDHHEYIAEECETEIMEVVECP